MENLKVENNLICDYVYVPIGSANNLILESNSDIYKESQVASYKGEVIYSPVSGKVYGITEVNTTKGSECALVIINDFKDRTLKRVVSRSDIYKVDRNTLDKITYKMKSEKVINLVIPNIYNHTKLLQDNVSVILETLNLINEKYDKDINIILSKSDVLSYQTLFSYIGAYPNITISFNNLNGVLLTIYDVIDLYNEIKGRKKRDYVYVTLFYNKLIKIVKVKKYSSLQEVLQNNGISGSSVVVNKKIKVDGIFILDESVNFVSIM